MIGWWLQTIGGLLAIVSAILLFCGTIVCPPEQSPIVNIFQHTFNTTVTIINQTFNTTIRTFYSSTQTIRTLPPFMGGNLTLNIDNLATAKLSGAFSASEVNLVVDVVPVGLPAPTGNGIKIDGLTFTDTSGATRLHFDTKVNKRHEIKIADRTFLIALQSIKQLSIADVARPFEFVFGISEK